MNRWVILFNSITWFVFAITTNPASSSENAVVVVNSRSASSKLIANYYVQLRDIPSQNVIHLANVPAKEVISIQEFRNKILLPIAKQISQRKINNHIDYIIYSSDFPTIINAKFDAKKLPRQNSSDPVSAANSKVLNPMVSITSATYFLNFVLSENAEYLSLIANTYARSDITHMLTRPFVDKEQRKFRTALSSAKDRRFEEAIEDLEALAQDHPLQLAVLYWLARTHAWQGNVDDAVQWLKRAVAVGWCYRNYTQADTAFASMQGNPDFQQLIAAIPNRPARYAPTTSFRNTYLWGPNGMINSKEGQGNRYILSAMLGVTRNQGNSEQQVLNYLTRSASADGGKPQGTFYFTKTKDVRSKTRLRGIDEAIEELQSLGHNSLVVNGKIPGGKTDIAGLSMGTASFGWPSGNRILAGAICENLTSFGGRLLPGTKQTKLTEFLKHGAAGSSGTVIEPFAIQAKFPHPRIHVHYVQGCTLAEAFYQSVTGPFQLLIVGDPLCRPWADIPTVAVSGGLRTNQTLSGAIEFEVEGSQSGKPVRVIEMYLDDRLVRRINGTKTGSITLQTDTIPDGYHEFRFVAVANGAIQSRGSKVVPINVDNNSLIVSLNAKSKTVRVDQEVELKVSAPKASKVVVKQNSREIAQALADQATFKIPATKLGRGPIRLEAVAFYDNTAIRSQPLDLTISGAISKTIPQLKAPPHQPNSKKKLAKPKAKIKS